MECICMYTPASHGGHALYTREVMTALIGHQRRGMRFELVSSEDLQEQFKAVPYRTHPILPVLKLRSEYKSRLAWAAGRVTHYAQRERQFVKWLQDRPDVS